MAPIARMLVVAATTLSAGFIAFGPMPQNSPVGIDVASAAPPPPAVVGPLRPPVVVTPPAASPAVSAALRTTTGTAAVALTFDDGPDPRYTPRILALLRKYHVKATFCLIGSRVRAYPGLVRAIVHDGHTLCNHTIDHDEHLRAKSDAHIAANLAATSALIRSAAGVSPKYFRAPGGNWSTRVRSIAARQGMQSLHWAVDPQDWRRPPASQIIANVTSHTRRGSIILMHDSGGDRSHTEAALHTLLPYLLKHYKLVAL
jgi:peptidoglycan/xylan/chitin deacetylase (PgdA/CDA1 family)